MDRVQGLVIISNRLVVFAFIFPDIATVVVDLGILWVESQGFVEVGNGLIVFVFVFPSDATVAVG